MITISVKQHGSKIQEIEITGHAGYANKGKDLVCAAVSAIGFGLCNTIDIMDLDASIHIVDNTVTIQTSDASDIIQTVLKTGLIQLETVAEQQNEFVKINKLEV